MKIKDYTETFPEYIQRNDPSVKISVPTGVGHWYRYIELQRGTGVRRTMFRQTRVEYPILVTVGEIWNETEIRILRKYWEEILIKLTPLVEAYEEKSGIHFTIGKINSLVEWGDY